MLHLQQNSDKQNVQRGIKNRQLRTAKIAGLISLVAFIAMFLPFHSWNKLHGNYAVTFLSLFVCLSAAVVAYMFRSRSRKLDKLISGESQIAGWVLDETEKKMYADHLFAGKKTKNSALFITTSLLLALVFGVFIIFMSEGRLFMFLFLLGIVALIAGFAFGMPYYYRYKNLKGDGNILIGRKYAYVNGFFHNWDFPLSGLDKVEIMNEPFRGLRLRYYYYTRTLRNEEVIEIPASQNTDMKTIIEKLKT